MCPASDVTAWVKEEQQYPAAGKGPHVEIDVVPKRFGKKQIKLEIYISHTVMIRNGVYLTIFPP